MAYTNYNHLLYYNEWSLCSTMVRLSYACRGEVEDAENEIIIKEDHIQLPKREQLTEHYLCDVNQNGEVPVLVPIDGKPIPDSQDITLYLARFYPSLIPREHSAEIQRLLKQLHEINFFSLTMAGKPESPLGNVKFLKERLGENISERYRAAIDVKIKRIEKQKVAAVADDEVESNIKLTEALMDEIKTILADSRTQWCFGLSRPSAFDAHLLIFVARVQDIGRGYLIPNVVKQWADNFMQTDEWKNLMQGRRTLPAQQIASSPAERPAERPTKSE